ncbi:ATP-binding cassette domain-containing protein [Yinghuangia seranimata]|uniref:ATP-binding cassette domain-containing protein n=1 Tax=Yinghuangia seranimata TaxID=408067 RepID=UPI00248AC90C|nr:ATP-binding cassette domain-containing protein [Yinghuangia seranimata]MDI2126615.1 ATP-binding cassette domain-containing protein [Yinghuangia seranimata]
MIVAHGLTKRFGEKTAVDGVDFSVPGGTVTGFLGPNGAGKSTTMRMILGLDRPTAGVVTVNGRRYDHLAAPLREVGALLDAKAMHGGRSAYNHLLWMAASNRIPKRRVSEVIEMVGLSDVAKKPAKGFSLGMGQRLGIAAAMLGDPGVLMFDEPVNGLDPEGILWIRNLMKQLASEGRTVFVSSHLMSEMALTAEHLVVIGRGRILADTDMRTFIDENSTNYVRVRSPQPEALRDALAAQGMQAEPDVAGKGALRVEGADTGRVGDAAGQAGVWLHELTLVQSSLEEAFMRLTAESVEYHAGVPGTHVPSHPPHNGDPEPGAEQPVGGGTPGWGPPQQPGGWGPPQPPGGPAGTEGGN